MELSPFEIEQFFGQGYIRKEGLFSASEVREMEQAMERLYEKSRPLTETQMLEGSQFVKEQDALQRVVWCNGAEPVLEKYALDPRLTEPASQLLNSKKMVQLICQAHFKMPGERVEFPWHQDSEHRRYGTAEWEDVNGRGSYVQTLMAVDPMDQSNGPLKMIAGTPRLGHLGLDQKTQEELPQVPFDQAELLELSPGSVIFFHPFLIHGSDLNRSDHPRRVLINGYASPGANHREYPGCGQGREIKLP